MLGGPVDGRIYELEHSGPYYCQTMKPRVHHDSGGWIEFASAQHEYLPTSLEIFLHTPPGVRHDAAGECVGFEEYPYSSSPRPCDDCMSVAYAGIAIRQPDGEFISRCVRCIARREEARLQMRSLT